MPGFRTMTARRRRAPPRCWRPRAAPLAVCQNRYSMLDRTVEHNGLLAFARGAGKGVAAAFSPLAQGLLSGRYLHGIPQGSRIARGNSVRMTPQALTPALLQGLEKLGGLAAARGQTLAQLALSWVLSAPGVTSVLVGASSAAQLRENAACLAAGPLFPAGARGGGRRFRLTRRAGAKPDAFARKPCVWYNLLGRNGGGKAMKHLTVGEMARLNHISEQTLRLYDKRGLLSPSFRGENGYRYYDIKQSAVLDIIQYMKSLGISLKEIGRQLENRDLGRIEAALREKQRQTEEEIRLLKCQRRALERTVESFARWRAARPTALCRWSISARGRCMWWIPA